MLGAKTGVEALLTASPRRACHECSNSGLLAGLLDDVVFSGKVPIKESRRSVQTSIGCCHEAREDGNSPLVSLEARQ